MEDITLLFPPIIQEAILKGIIKIDNLQRDFSTLNNIFRAVNSAKGNNIDREDFRSQIEIGTIDADENDPEDYSCSCFADFFNLKKAMHLPRKKWNVAKGSIRSINGPIDGCNSKDNHINWYVYENAKPEIDFEVLTKDEFEAELSRYFK